MLTQRSWFSVHLEIRALPFLVDTLLMAIHRWRWGSLPFVKICIFFRFFTKHLKIAWPVFLSSLQLNIIVKISSPSSRSYLKPADTSSETPWSLKKHRLCKNIPGACIMHQVLCRCHDGISLTLPQLCFMNFSLTPVFSHPRLMTMKYEPTFPIDTARPHLHGNPPSYT